MRQIVLDTETTGLEPADGHRIIEIGAVEMVDRRRTQARFHHFLNPDRSVDSGALEVHGITDQFLDDKPRFADIADELLSFLGGAELIIHNAAFDIGFIEHELRLLGRRTRIEENTSVVDSLELARKLHPGMRNSLDALCKRYDVDNSRRQLHGALLDAEMLAEVYLRMTGGQTTLSLAINTDDRLKPSFSAGGERLRRPHVRRANEAELRAHNVRLEQLERVSGRRLWPLS